MNTKSFKTRIRIVALCVFLFACILVLKLFTLGIVHQNKYAERADKQYATPTGDMFDRGNIFFTKKDGSQLAGGNIMTGYKIAIKAKDITDPEALYNILLPYTKLTHDEFIKKATNINDPYEEVANRLTKENADAISQMKIAGVTIYKEKWRFYPGDTLAAHTVGFVAYKGDERVGQYGLEKFYNQTLMKPKEEAYINFFAEVFSNIGKTFSNTKEGDIVTTIEPTVQGTLESEMKITFEKWNADQIGAIIMDPNTGEIYAMSAYPTFDLNNFGSVENPKTYANPLVESVFEFGSVIKPLVVAGALDQGVITPETTYIDKGFVVVNKKTINNFDKKARGLATMQTVLDQSLNTGMVFIENKMGHDSFRKYMKNYSMGEKTGIDLPNETSGLVKNLDSKIDLDYANMSFGQGLAITPIGGIRAFSTLANGGNIVTPHLVKQIKYNDGTSNTLSFPIVKSDILKKESTDTITRMLVHVFDSYGNGSYKLEHYSVATKTGTAQVALDTGKGYYDDRHTHSFFGYFPAYKPKFIVFLFIKNPKGARYASETLIPPFVNITKFLLNYYNIPPDR
ncbi:penicillin-binding protein 2 [Candidatus Nomurabacteria bacterium]|nr:penicillin-binding protein 2 [Candidatus Nomurabacteria bacterium]